MGRSILSGLADVEDDSYYAKLWDEPFCAVIGCYRRGMKRTIFFKTGKESQHLCSDCYYRLSTIVIVE